MSDSKNTNESAMNSLDARSLQYLAGVRKTIEECGMMGGGMATPHTPASINVTAGSGSELSSMLKDIMNLAGVHKVEPEHMPVDNPESPTKVISAPPMHATPSHGDDMKRLLSKLDYGDEVEMEVDEDSMNSSEEGVYDNSPEETGKVGTKFPGGEGDVDNNFSNALVGKDKHHKEAFENLYSEYKNFVAEEKKPKGKKCNECGNWMSECSCDEVKENKKSKCCCKEKGKKACPVHGKVEESKKGKCCCKEKSKKKCPVHGKMEEGFRPPLPQQKIAGKKADLQAIAQSGRIGSGPGPEMANGGTGRVPFQSKEYTKYIRDRAAKAKKALSNMEEAKKPSAGMSKKAKSKLVKKAKKGGDIGKKGKNFEKVAKKAGGGEKGKRIAAAAMWKNAAKK